MRSFKFHTGPGGATAWDHAVDLMTSYLRNPGKADERISATTAELPPQARRTRQALFLSALRYAHRTRHALSKLVSRDPGQLPEAILLTAGAELVDANAEDRARIVHHAVERAKNRISQRETAFLNAVLRRLAVEVNSIDPETEPAAYHSHPDWLVARWIGAFGRDQTLLLLDWNQKSPQTYLRMLDTEEPVAGPFERTQWEGFLSVPAGTSWEAHVLPRLRTGEIYIKDPSTRFAIDLLAPSTGETVLDLCAAPGGKTRDCARRMIGGGRIVAVDLPGLRADRLRGNLGRLPSPRPAVDVVEADAATLTPEQLRTLGKPGGFDAVLLDAPCSNTGVIQRRTDVKLRLRPGSIEQAAKLQRRLLANAARFVRPGGRLVYSTCSIEAAENREVVEAFTVSAEGRAFDLADAVESIPWESGHDGAAAFLLIRTRGGKAQAAATPTVDQNEETHRGEEVPGEPTQ